MIAGVGEGDAVSVGVCFGIWLDVGPLVELGTDGWRQGVGLWWDLLRERTGLTGMGEGEGVRIRVWVGVTGVKVCVGVWAGVEVRARVV